MNKLRIRKLGILSVAKMYAVMLLIIALIFCIPYGLFIIVIALSGASNMGGENAWVLGGGGVAIGLMVMIGVPIIYSLFGFIGGIIVGLIYNILAGIVGGVEIEVENVY